MNKSGRFFWVILLSAIYFFAIGIYLKSPVQSDIQHSQTTAQAKLFSIAYSDLFCQPSQSESSVNNFTNFTTPSFTNKFNKHWAISKIPNLLVETKFSQYTTFSINFLIQHRKSNLIFPFHYFW